MFEKYCKQYRTKNKRISAQVSFVTSSFHAQKITFSTCGCMGFFCGTYVLNNCKRYICKYLITIVKKHRARNQKDIYVNT